MNKGIKTRQDVVKRPFVALSFDDGRKDNITIAVPILKQYNIPATFSITTAYVDGSCSKDSAPCLNEPMTVEDVRELYRNLDFEIACHGNQHNNDRNNIHEGRKKLFAWLELKPIDKLGFASPESLVDLNDIKHFESENFAYIRTGIRMRTRIRIRTFVRRFSYYIFRSRTGFISAYKETLIKPIENNILFCLPIMRRTTISQLIGAIKWANHRGHSIIILFHSILNKEQPYYKDAWTWDVKRFRKLCKHLDTHRNDGDYYLSTTIDGFLSHHAALLFDTIG